jgi:hypothetical protein
MPNLFYMSFPLVRQQQQQPVATAATSRWNQPAAGSVAPPTAAVGNMATTVTDEPEFSRGSHHHQAVSPPLMFGPFPYQGPRPQVLKQAMFVPLPRYSGTESIGGATVAADAREYGNAAGSLLQPLNLGTGPHGHDELAAMTAYTESNDPPVAEAATNPTIEQVLNNGDSFSTYSTSLMAPNQVLDDMASDVNELAMAGGAIFSNDDASFTAPQDLAAALDGGQLAPGALDAISASLMETDGNPGLELEAMFSPDQYENTLFPLEALLGLDDAPVYEDGQDYRQGGGSADDEAAGTSLIGGADDSLDVLDDYLFMDNAGDFNDDGRD